MNEKLPISVVVLTKNEEERIADCLESVKWADEIIVVDDYSTDKTVEIARKYTDKIFLKKMDVEGRHRNWAYSKAKHEWILSLDADERVTIELSLEIAKVINLKSNYGGFTIPRKNYIGDYWVRYGGWYPSPQLKLFRKDKFRYEESEVHPRAFMDEPCGHLQNAIIHYSYRDFEDFLNKLDRQSSLEAQKWYNQSRPMRLGRFLWRTIDRFMRTYIGKRGWKDGKVGFKVACFAGLYQWRSYLKYKKLISHRGGR